MAEESLWVVRCDRTDIDPIAENVVAIGWEDIGDVSGVSEDRQPFRDLIAEHRPAESKAKRAASAGHLYRFRHEMQEGHLVVFPNKFEKTVNIGRIAGPYFYADVPHYRHRRPVEWLKVGLDRTPTFSQGALYEIGATLTVFRIKTHAAEFISVLKGTQPAPTVVAEEAEEAESSDEPDAERIREATRDFILTTFATELKGQGVAEFVGELLRAAGFRMVKVSPPGKDYGIDVLASRDPLGLEPPTVKVQVKSGEGKSGAPEVSGLLGRLGAGEVAMFFSLGGFSNDALELDRSKPELRLVGPDELVELIYDRYDALSPRAQAKLPLSQVWVRDPETA
jgi:restriction system protein